MESIAKVKSGEFEESDLQQIYKTQNSEFKSDEFESQLSGLDSKEYQSYSSKNDTESQKMMSTLQSKGLNSTGGQQAFTDMKSRMDSGMMSRQDYNGVVSKEVETMKPKVDRTMVNMAQSQSKTALDLDQKQIPQLQEKIRKMEASDASRREANPNSKIADNPKLAELRGTLSNSMSQKEQLMDSLQSKMSNSKVSNGSEDLQQRLVDLGLKKNERSTASANTDDILKKHNPELHARRESRVASAQAYSTGYSKVSQDDFKINNMTFDRGEDGKLNTDSYTKGKRIYTGERVEEEKQDMSQEEVTSLMEEQAKRHSELNNYNNSGAAPDEMRTGQLKAEIESLQAIIDKYKK
jgi:hypothetical protein